jgi:hypothetical protein
MSISDYLKYKRVTNELKQIAKYPPVLSAADYTDFKEFAIEKQLAYVNNTQGYNSPVNNNGSIFGMSLKTSGCATFPLCRQTQTRQNRIPMSSIYVDPTPIPLYQKVYPSPRYAANCDPTTWTDFNSVDVNTQTLCNTYSNSKDFYSENLNKKQIYAKLQGLQSLIR